MPEPTAAVELGPEALHHVLPVEPSAGDVVEFLLQPGGEIIGDIFGRNSWRGRRSRAGPCPPGISRPLSLRDIFAVLDGADDGGIGGGPPDAEFLHPLDQRRLGVARRGLGEVLLRRHLFLRRDPRFRGSGGGGLSSSSLDVVPAFLVDACMKPVEGHDLPGGAQAHRIGRDRVADLHRGAHASGRLPSGRRSRASRSAHRAGPAHVRGLKLIGGLASIRGGADALMRLLRVLGLVLVHPRGFRARSPGADNAA